MSSETGQRAVIEMPIKTINTSPPPLTADVQPASSDKEYVGTAAADRWQVDTGPIIFHDLSLHHPAAGGLRLAYVGFNNFSRADFIVEVETPFGDQQLPDYSKLLSLDATVRLFASVPG